MLFFLLEIKLVTSPTQIISFQVVPESVGDFVIEDTITGPLSRVSYVTIKSLLNCAVGENQPYCLGCADMISIYTRFYLYFNFIKVFHSIYKSVVFYL